MNRLGMNSELTQEIAEIAESARIYVAAHTRIAELVYPRGIRLAVNFMADFDAMLLHRLMNKPAKQLAKGEFGGRVSIWRLIEPLDTHDAKATIFTPAAL